MSRRTHKKSRNGCLPCKRRHIRCDENHPICSNCNAAEIRCSFLGKDSPQVVAVYSQDDAHAAATLEPVETSRQTFATSQQEPFDKYSLNMTHLALFNNLSNIDFLSPKDLMQPDVIPMALYMKYALTTPYLMHQLLATSAFHLSLKAAKSRMVYREYATGLQTQALSLFNESNPILEVSSANCAQMFLFSALIGVHLLCDALHFYRDSLGEFIHRFAHCLSVHCGILAITSQSIHLLQETEVGAHLTSPHVFQQPPPTSDPDFGPLQDLLRITELSLTSRDACRNAILRLQQVFEAQRSAPESKLRMPLAFAWPALLSPEYIELLRQQQAEALIILGHYAMLLHRGRDLWLIGDGGRFLINSIRGSLGSKWQKYLEVPIATLEKGP